MILAPFVPFLAEELYRNLTGGESVHLLDWPEVGHIDELVIKNMSFTRLVISEGLAQRAEAGYKVRQPLASVNIYDKEHLLTDEFQEIIREELNVKKVEFRDSLQIETDVDVLERWRKRESSEEGWPVAALNLSLTSELRQEGLMREIIRNVQQARKLAGLEVDDRITLELQSTASELQSLLKQKELTNIIKRETLTTSLNSGPVDGFSKLVKVDGFDLEIRLAKANKS
jgi:isoleucyl-tRNA synthetase